MNGKKYPFNVVIYNFHLVCFSYVIVSLYFSIASCLRLTSILQSDSETNLTGTKAATTYGRCNFRTHELLKKVAGFRRRRLIIMKFERVKKIVVSLSLTVIFILSSGLASTSLVRAQGWGQWRREQRRENRWERERRMQEERESLDRIRRLDRDRQLR